MLRLGRLIPEDDAVLPDVLGWPPEELLELEESLEDIELDIIDPRSPCRLCELCDDDSELHGVVELKDELVAEAVDDGLNGELEDALIEPDPPTVVPLATFDGEVAYALLVGTEPAGLFDDGGADVPASEPEPVGGLGPDVPWALLEPAGDERPFGEAEKPGSGGFEPDPLASIEGEAVFGLPGELAFAAPFPGGGADVPVTGLEPAGGLGPDVPWALPVPPGVEGPLG